MYRIKMETLLESLGLDTIEGYIFRRQLRWFGHVCRMPFARTPRKFLSSWVSAKRPLGAPDYTYGRGVEKASVTVCGVNSEKWT